MLTVSIDLDATTESVEFLIAMPIIWDEGMIEVIW